MRNESSVTPMEMVNNILRRLDWGGYNPRNRTVLKLFISYIFFFWSIIMVVLQIIYLLTNNYKNFGSMIMDIVLIVGIWQVAVKNWTLIVKHRQLLTTINSINEEFWSLDNLKRSQQEEIQKIYYIANLIANSYMTFIFSALIGFCITTYFLDKEILPNSIWLPTCLKEINKSSPGHEIIFLTLTTMMAATSITGMIQLDCLYFVVVALGVAQFRVLKYKLMSINEMKCVKDSRKEIIKCIQHHNLLFNYVYSIEDIFSFQLLQVAGLNMIIGVLELLAMLIENDLSRKITYSLMCISIMSQLFIYCLLGQFLQDESLSLTDASYFSEWENVPDKNIRRSLILIIMRSQKHLNFTLGGLFTLRLETFTKFSNMMFSFLTFMINFGTEKENN